MPSANAWLHRDLLQVARWAALDGRLRIAAANHQSKPPSLYQAGRHQW